MKIAHKKIPVYQPDLSGNEKKYVDECIESTWISSKGKFVEQFEKSFAKFCGMDHAVSVSNGTVALHLALLALGIGKGDEVIVPTLTYIASVNAITYVGAKPVFVDSLEDSWQMDPSKIEGKVTKSTKAIMAVHLYGQPCDMGRIVTIAAKHNLKVVEDCAEAIGSKIDNKHVGSFGDIATFSFFGNKTITTGEGGMVLSNNEKLADKVRHLKGQGLKSGEEYWHDVIGYNYRMTNVCAAIGCAQLERINDFLARKKQIAEMFTQGISKVPGLATQGGSKTTVNSYWMYSILVNPELRDKLRKHLAEGGVETRPLFHPVHTMPMYGNGFEKYPIAENLSSRGINLPSWPGLKDEDVYYIVSLIVEFISGQ